MDQHSVILFGTGAQFSVAVLDHLLAHGLKPVALVLPEFAPTVLKGLGETLVDGGGIDNRFVIDAKRLSIPLIYLPESSQSSGTDKIAEFKSDFLLVACWPYLLRPEIIGAVDKVALNLHPSKLPGYRGADPIAEQIEAQERALGVSLHLLSQKFDSGDIISQAGLDIGTLFPQRELIEAQAARVGTRLFIEVIQKFGSPDWRPQPQCV